MKRAVGVGLAVLSFGLLWLAAGAQDQDIKAGRLEVTDKNWDFGFIPRGAKVTHHYLLKNVGTDTLKITNVRKSCGCTYAPLGKDVLPPGDTTLLEVTFNSGSYQGAIQKSVYVESNDPIQPFMDIVFNAMVSVPANALSFDPFFISFDTVRNLPMKAVIKVANLDSNSISFSVLESPSPFVTVKTRKKKIAPGKETEIQVEMVSATPPGEFGTSFTLVCDDAKKSRFTIPVKGFFISPK